MASSSHSTLSQGRNDVTEQEGSDDQEQQQQQRCICQGTFSHEEHRRWPELFSPVAQNLTNVAFGRVTSICAVFFGFIGITALLVSLEGLGLAAQSNFLANTANQLTLLHRCLSNSTFDENLCAWVVSHSKIALPRGGAQWYPERVFADVEHPDVNVRMYSDMTAFIVIFFTSLLISVYYYNDLCWRHLKKQLLETNIE